MNKNYIFILFIMVTQCNNLPSNYFISWFRLQPQEIPFDSNDLIIKQYQKIINSWQTQYWHLQGFKAHDFITLTQAIQHDISSKKISSADQLDNIFNPLIESNNKKTSKFDTEINHALQIIKQKICDKNFNHEIKEDNNITGIKTKVFKISQSQYDGRKESIVPTVKELETIDEYIQENTQKAYRGSFNLKNTIKKNLQDFKFVIDSRGDGNCGYRSFFISACMNNPTLINYFQKLVNEKFILLFTKYDTNFNHNKEKDAQTIHSYLIQILNQIKILSQSTSDQKKSLQNLIDLFNKEIEFDYFIIMFLRYLMVDFIKKNPTLEVFAFFDSEEGDPIEQKKTAILKWKEEMDNADSEVLSHATSITIHTTQERAETHSQSKTTIQNSIGDAYILYTTNPGHYKILIHR